MKALLKMRAFEIAMLRAVLGAASHCERRQLSEVQGPDPMVLVLSRGLKRVMWRPQNEPHREQRAVPTRWISVSSGEGAAADLAIWETASHIWYTLDQREETFVTSSDEDEGS